MNRKQITKYLNHDLPYILVILICCIVAYWPVSFFVYSLKNDALNYFLPVRFQVSEAINNGFWPFWSPYFNLGYPLHGDMQSGVWNPFVQIISLFGAYTLKTLQFETVLYVFLSGLGMFYLIKHFKIDKKICLLISVSYMLCGYNSDSAQFLNWISSAAFLPFVILFFYRSLSEHSWKPCMICGLFIYIYFVTAYPADFIILSYLLLSLFIWHVVTSKQYMSIQKFLPLIKKMAIIAVVFLLLSAPAILSYLQFLPLSERGSGTSFKQAMICPLHPLLLFSYVTPLGVWKAPYVGITDPLERNCYFGIIAFAFLLYGLFLKTNSKWIRFCKWAFVITLIFSFGEMGGLRPLSYYFLPLMDTFRSPANAKIFTVFFACIISAFSLQDANTSNNRNKLTYPLVALFCFLLILLAWCFTGRFTLHTVANIVQSQNAFSHSIKELLDNSTFSDLLLINILVQTPFLFILYLYIKGKASLKTIVYTGILNSVIHASLFMPFTVVKKDDVATIQNILNKETIKGYPLPREDSSIFQNSINGEALFDEIGTLNMYNKKIGRVDYRITPCNLNNQNAFWQNDTGLRNLLIIYPLLYKADTLIHIKDYRGVYATPQKIALIENRKIAQTNYPAAAAKITFEKFTPNNWDIKISSEEPGFYCLFQSHYPNWKLYVDGKESKINLCNISFMGFSLAKGTHVISFKYQAPFIKTAFFISLFCFMVIAILSFRKA